MAEKKAFVFDTNFIIQNQNLNDALDKLKENSPFTSPRFRLMNELHKIVVI